MYNPIYSLQKYTGQASRYTCPACGKARIFTRYVHIESGEHLADHVGRCNREVNCGYHYTPKSYFADNPHSATQATTQNIAQRITQKVAQHSTIPFHYLEKTLNPTHYGRNNFVQYLKSTVGSKWEDCVKRFYVGNANHWPGSTVFWQVDRTGSVRTGKIILFDISTGKRIKEPYPHITWVHTQLSKTGLLKDFNLNQCLFGEHQLNNEPNKPVGIVESEKTAILASAYLPELTWMACGSLRSITAQRLSAVSRNAVILYPDIRGFDLWESKAHELRKNGFRITVSNLLETAPFVTDSDRANGLDLGDYLPRITPIKTDLERLIERNPAIATLIERFDLTVL